MSIGKHVNYEWPPPGTVTPKGYFQWKTGVPDLEEGMGGTGHKNGEQSDRNTNDWSHFRTT